MSYVVLARKWRPQTFADLVGQDHVSRTLANAIASDRVAHAFLFTGVRGVGKTSTARMLARALNCERGPTAEPCLTCDACVQIGAGTDVDVQEIDGASYTGVEAVRSLQETIPYRPARDRFKIYIVDEVHMLSNAAWNAFLKTLEEPPPHVKFIFATTEVQKVPVTILSRCQRYDFKLIATSAIATRLKTVLEEEKIAADDEAIRIVAREAAGSMRDAMSLLDQVIAWIGGTDERLSAENVARVLGVASRSVLHRLAAAVVDRDPSVCLDIVAGLAQQGFPLAQVARDFLEHLRMVVVAKVSREPTALLEVADDELADIAALAERAQVDDLSRLYLGFSRAYDDIARSAQVRGAFEMALVRLAHRPPLVPLDDLLERLSALEQRLSGSGRRGGGGGPSSTTKSRGGRSSSAGRGGAPTRAAPREAGAEGVPVPTPPSPSNPERAPAAPPAGASPASATAPSSVASDSRAVTSPSPVAVEMRDTTGGAPPAFVAPPFPVWKGGPRPSPSPSPEPDPLPSERADVEPKPRKPPVSPLVLEAWEAILDRVRVDKPPVASVFEHAAPLEVTPERLQLGYPPGSFLLQQAQSHVTTLEAAASQHFGRPTTVEIDLSKRHGEVETVAERNAAQGRERERLARRRVETHPLVVAAREVLGARIRDVRLPPG
ncbi:MAG: DNA polymerase III subunit gamma/tau [Myxococcota bacterium]